MARRTATKRISLSFTLSDLVLLLGGLYSLPPDSLGLKTLKLYLEINTEELKEALESTGTEFAAAVTLGRELAAAEVSLPECTELKVYKDD